MTNGTEKYESFGSDPHGSEDLSRKQTVANVRCQNLQGKSCHGKK